MNNVEIRVQSIQFSDDNTARINFSGADSERQINISGYVAVTIEEYEANSQMELMKDLVRQKAVEHLNGGNNE
ncbi:hypothetical protein [Halalkalibacterium halodurans]|nr:hypothetical protein [Halalkalibacterium halodurans]MDY7222093.1 hypothetical protein [Halalkalibacterium halodurans]MDY7243888.1 hypothetical protein [Halalkalibacterium halodurans]TPE68014.1 hypothetical protein AMD02_015750 [Halalkalibacterium halodurans]